MDNEIVNLEDWMDYGTYRIFSVQNKYGKFFKAMNIGDDPDNPVDGHAYGRTWRKAVAFLMQAEAEQLIKESGLDE